MRVLPAGARALLVEVSGLAEVRALRAELLLRRADGRLPPVEEIVPGARTLLLDGIDEPGLLAHELAAWTVPPVPAPRGPVVVVPTVYDGPDLQEVAASWGVSAAAAVELHASVEFEVAFCGFAPGFAYLAGLPERFHVGRRPTPRVTVPAGSVGLGGAHCGVYPRPSPGGWQLIGRTDLVVWDPSRAQPGLLAPGTRVRFVPVSR